MGKIPRNLTDREMFQGMEAEKESSIEEQFLSAEKKTEVCAKVKAQPKEELYLAEGLALAGLKNSTLDALGKEIFKLKMELMQDGVKDPKFQVAREGKRIVIFAIEK